MISRSIGATARTVVEVGHSALAAGQRCHLWGFVFLAGKGKKCQKGPHASAVLWDHRKMVGWPKNEPCLTERGGLALRHASPPIRVSHVHSYVDFIYAFSRHQRPWFLTGGDWRAVVAPWACGSCWGFVWEKVPPPVFVKRPTAPLAPPPPFWPAPDISYCDP